MGHFPRKRRWEHTFPAAGTPGTEARRPAPGKSCDAGKAPLDFPVPPDTNEITRHPACGDFSDKDPPLPSLSDVRSPLARLALRSALVLAAALPLTALRASADDVGEEGHVAHAPSWMTFYAHRNIAVDPGFGKDADLQTRLERAVDEAGLRPMSNAGDLGVALVDLNDLKSPKLASVQGDHMIYAASIPKIAVLYSAFQKRKDGKLDIDPAFRETLHEMCRVSDNHCASAAIQKVGFPYIASVLWQSGLYDPKHGGGLWVGKAYGGTNDYWHRDPVNNLSHGATANSLARLLTLLAQDRLVDAQASAEMKDLLGNTGLHHKFVRGLDSRPSTIYRKSGSWSHWHGDAAIVEREGKRYVAVALCESDQGEQILEQLILHLDDCVGNCTAPVTTAQAQPSTLGG
jgi:beta-lactamase class A